MSYYTFINKNNCEKNLSKYLNYLIKLRIINYYIYSDCNFLYQYLFT